MSIKVSIVVPVYGVERYVEKCARSLFSQTYSNIEYLFVNDCTKDSSIDIIKKVLNQFPNRIESVHIIEHKVNKGLSAARETGIQSATGQYILHVDSDDYVDVNIVQDLVERATIDNCDIVISGFFNEYAKKKMQDLSVCQKLECSVYLSKIISQDILTPIWGKLIKTDLYKKNNIHCIETISFAEDYAVLPRLLFYANTIGFVSKPLYNYTHYNSSSLTNNFKWKDVSDKVMAQNCIDNFFIMTKSFGSEIRVSNLKRRAWLLRSLMSNGLPLEKSEGCFSKFSIKISDINKLSLSHFIILYLDKMKFYLLLSLFVKSGNWVLKHEKTD